MLEFVDSDLYFVQDKNYFINPLLQVGSGSGSAEKKYRIRIRRAKNQLIRPDPDPQPRLQHCVQRYAVEVSSSIPHLFRKALLANEFWSWAQGRRCRDFWQLNWGLRYFSPSSDSFIFPHPSPFDLFLLYSRFVSF